MIPVANLGRVTVGVEAGQFSTANQRLDIGTHLALRLASGEKGGSISSCQHFVGGDSGSPLRAIAVFSRLPNLWS